MSTLSQIVQTLQVLLTERADVLARETNFIQRQRQLVGSAFAQMEIFAHWQEPDITVEGLTQVLQRRGVTISGPGLCQRYTSEAATFMHRLLQEVSQAQMQVQAVPIALLEQFSAVYVQDSSVIALPESLAKVWRGCGGREGSSQAALKLFARWDVLNGHLDGPMITDGCHSDKRSPLDEQEIPAGAVEIDDLGFWAVARLNRLAHRGQARQQRRYFLSRLQPGTKLRRRSGAEIVLRGVLPRQVGERVEFGGVLGACRLPVRVVIEHVPAEVGEQRRQEIREKAEAHGRQAGEEVLFLADWTILITNIPRRMVTFDQVLILARLRWQIERLFRLWKEHGHIDEWRSHNPWRILTETYAKLIAMVIQQWLLHEGCWHDPHRSLVKAAQVLRREANLIMRALLKGDLEEVLSDILSYMRSGCRLQTRRQRPNTSQFLMGQPHRWPPRPTKNACSLLT